MIGEECEYSGKYQNFETLLSERARTNSKVTINKLQKALIQKGIIYKLNTYQFFSAEQKRMITGYSIREKQAVQKPNGDIIEKEVELFNTCSQIEVLKWFAEEWRKAKEAGGC